MLFSLEEGSTGLALRWQDLQNSSEMGTRGKALTWAPLNVMVRNSRGELRDLLRPF